MELFSFGNLNKGRNVEIGNVGSAEHGCSPLLFNASLFCSPFPDKSRPWNFQSFYSVFNICIFIIGKILIFYFKNI